MLVSAGNVCHIPSLFRAHMEMQVMACKTSSHMCMHAHTDWPTSVWRHAPVGPRGHAPVALRGRASVGPRGRTPVALRGRAPVGPRGHAPVGRGGTHLWL